MEDQSKEPVIKDLSVILKRESFVEFKHKFSGLKFVKSDNYINVTTIKPTKKHISNPNQINSSDLNKSRNLECIVILEQFEANEYEQTKDSTHQVKLVENESALNKSKDIISIREKINDGKLALVHVQDRTEKLPVYNKIIENESQKHDLYEFDEPDTDEIKNSGKSKRPIRKKKKIKTVKNGVNENKKPKRNKVIKSKTSYKSIIEDILANVIKKIDKGKFEGKKSPAIRNDTIQNISQIGWDVNKYNNDKEVNKKTSEVNNDLHTSEDDVPNRDSQFFVCLYPVQTNKKIHVISDVTLDTNDNSSFLPEHLEPKETGTIPSGKKCVPWRFDENLKRNPHYLNIKKSALPCLQQDMVIDYKQLKHIQEHFAEVPKQLKTRKNKPLVLTEELECFYDISNQENIPHSSLFDDFLTDQEKLVPESNNKPPQKRKILGLIQENVVSRMTTKINVSQNKIQTETFPNPKYLKNTVVGKIQENIKTVPENVSTESVSSCLVPALFEDEEPSLNFSENSKIYTPKMLKKKKFLVYNTKESHQNKHKKDILTKSEEAAIDQWAARFNSLCEDIENHKLEIE